MANIKWGQNVDANQKQILNGRAHNVNGNPSTPGAGQFWYDTATGKLMYQDGVGAAAIDVRSRTTHTGTQLASTISNFDAQVRTSRLDQMAVPTALLNFNSQRLTAVATPTTGTDAANRDYVDTALTNATAGITYKEPVRAATTANITLSAPQTVDGVSVIAGQRVLVKNQSTASQNGIYQVAAGAWVRTADANLAAELQGGVIVPVDEGTANGNTMWMLATDVTTLDTDAVTWIQFGAGSAYTASLGAQLVGNDIRANLGTGLTLSGNQIVPDYAQIMRRKVAVGFVGTTGVDIAVAHGFALANKSDFIAEVTEDATGAKILVGVVGTDINTVTLSFETTPTTNQYRYQIIGLS